MTIAQKGYITCLNRVYICCKSLLSFSLATEALCQGSSSSQWKVEGRSKSQMKEWMLQKNPALCTMLDQVMKYSVIINICPENIFCARKYFQPPRIFSFAPKNFFICPRKYILCADFCFLLPENIFMFPRNCWVSPEFYLLPRKYFIHPFFLVSHARIFCFHARIFYFHPFWASRNAVIS